MVARIDGHCGRFGGASRTITQLLHACWSTCTGEESVLSRNGRWSGGGVVAVTSLTGRFYLHINNNTFVSPVLTINQAANASDSVPNCFPIP